MKVLLLKSVSDEIFEMLFGEVRDAFGQDELYILCREIEREKLSTLYPDEKFITFGGEKFNAFRLSRELGDKIRAQGIERVVVLFRDEYGARYFHYRLFPILLGHKTFSSINKRKVHREHGLAEWWKNLILEESRARFLSLFYFFDIAWFFLNALFLLVLKKGGILKRPGGNQANSILFFIASLGMGGAQRQLFFLTEELRKKGFHVDIVCIWKDDALFEKRFVDLGINVTYLVSEHEYWFAFKICKRLRNLMGQKNYAIIHNWMLLSNIFGTLAGARMKLPVIVNSVRTLDLPRYSWYKKWYRFADVMAYRLSDVTLVNSNAVLEDYRNWIFGSGNEDKIQIVYNGFDRSLFDLDGSSRACPVPLPEDKKVIGFFGRLSEEKGVFVFLETIDLLSHKRNDFVAIICGGGYQMSDAISYVEERAIGHVVSFLGFQDDVLNIMRKCDVVVSTSAIEGLPNSLIEAQFLGIPVVATDAGGSIEVLEDGITGFLAPRGDAAEIANKIGRLLDSRELLERFGRNAETRARELFAIEKTVEEVLSVYQNYHVRNIRLD